MIDAADLGYRKLLMVDGQENRNQKNQIQHGSHGAADDAADENLLRIGNLGFLIVIGTALCAFAVYLAAFGFRNFSLPRLLGEILPWFVVSPDQDTWGQFGDFVGGVLNPVIGLLTVYLVLVSVRLQRKELRETRAEMKNSNAALKHQAFEQTFFTWLQSYRAIVSDVTYTMRDETLAAYGEPVVPRDIHGLRALHQAYTDHLSEHAVERVKSARVAAIFKEKGWDAGVAGLSTAEKRSVVLDRWEDLYELTEHHIASMFRTFYRLVKWVHEHPDLSAEEKWQYVGIARAQLSNIEMVYFFLNGHTALGGKFNFYIDRYALFDNMRFESDPVLKSLREAQELPFGEAAFKSELAKPKKKKGTGSPSEVAEAVE